MEFHTHRTGRKKKKAKLLFAIVVIVVSLALIFQEGYYRYKLDYPLQKESEVIPFIINRGEVPSGIASRLQEEGFIDSSWVFLRYAKKSGEAGKFQAGKFYLYKNTPYKELSKNLTKAALSEISVTIPEGFTNAEIDEQLVSLTLITPGEFQECISSCDLSDFPFLPKDVNIREGFFFPDTYYVNPSQFDIESFTKRLLSTFDEKTKTIFGNAQRNGWDILKMASIIEKESHDTEERPMVAGILWKRLDNKWMLGADATTRYITGKKTDSLTVTDLTDENAWNTRANHGLPPGAICNPGLSAIWSATNSEESEYWYYLHGTDGKIHYAKTLEEHSKNKEEYL